MKNLQLNAVDFIIVTVSNVYTVVYLTAFSFLLVIRASQIPDIFIALNGFCVIFFFLIKINVLK